MTTKKMEPPIQYLSGKFDRRHFLLCTFAPKFTIFGKALSKNLRENALKRAVKTGISMGCACIVIKGEPNKENIVREICAVSRL